MTLKKSRKEHKKEYDRKRHLKLKDQRKKDYLENREEKIKYQKIYVLKNKEKIKEYAEGYWLKNKKHLKEYSRKNIERTRNWERNRYQTDINFRLSKLCRNRVRVALKGLNKSASTMELIGCTPDELRKHIESLFQPWMTWENQGVGGWDVDHIKACFHFNLADPEQQCACFNWSNLQPMEHIANIKKGTG